MVLESDRLTQLQECANKLTELLFLSVGVLQRDAPLIETNPEIPVTCWSKEQTENNWRSNQELAKSAAKDIVHLSKIMDFLIDNLPGQTKSQEEQIEELEKLEGKNREMESELHAAIIKGEEMEVNWKKGLDLIMKEQESNI